MFSLHGSRDTETFGTRIPLSYTQITTRQRMSLIVYDPDLPIHMKPGVILLKETVEQICHSSSDKDYQLLSEKVIDINREIMHGLINIKNNGYITEGMAKGEPTPNWVPVKKEQAIKEAMEFLKNDKNLSKDKKTDKRGKSAYTEEEWEEIKAARKEKASDKKRKLEEYDELNEQLETAKEKARSYKEKFLKCKAYFLSNGLSIPE